MDATSPPPPPPGGIPANPPGASGALVCGILSIVFCWFPLAGLPLGIIALVLAGKAKKAVNRNPGAYNPGGLRTGGFVCGIIGTVFSAIYFVFWIIAITVVSNAPGFIDDINRQIREQERIQREREQAPVK